MGIRSFIHRLTAPSPSSSAPAGDYKLALLVNHELKMGKGKIGAQAGHVFGQIGPQSREEKILKT